MNKRQKTATVLLYIVAAVSIGFGFMYIYKGFTTGLMPYHIKFLGKTCEELGEKECFLMKTFMRIIGFCFTAIGVALILLTRGLFNKQQDKLDWTTIFVMILISMVPLLPITISVGPFTPWAAVAGLLVLWIIALILARPQKKG